MESSFLAKDQADALAPTMVMMIWEVNGTLRFPVNGQTEYKYLLCEPYKQSPNRNNNKPFAAIQ